MGGHLPCFDSFDALFWLISLTYLVLSHKFDRVDIYLVLTHQFDGGVDIYLVLTISLIGLIFILF